jgi:hypothetical protein
MPTIPVLHLPGKDHHRPAARSVRKGRLLLLLIIVITCFGPPLLTLHGLKADRMEAAAAAPQTPGTAPPPAPPPSADQVMSFAYFIEQGDMTSTIRLNNNLPDVTEAIVTIFNHQGQAFTAPTLDEGFTTVLHLKNTIAKRAFALVQVRYTGGSYNLERLALQPFQTIAVDLRQLRDGQQADIRGDVMPKEVSSGQLVWFEETVGSLIGRNEVRNVAEGWASSFSCGEMCPCPPASSQTYLTPGASVGPMGGTAQFQAMEQRQDCRGTVFGPYNRTADSSWSSSNASVFMVNGGLVSCLQPGSGTLMAQFQGTVYGQHCNAILITQRPTGPVTVVSVTIQKAGGSALPSPLRVGISATTLDNQAHDRSQQLQAVVTPADQAANVVIVPDDFGKLTGTRGQVSNGVIQFSIVGKVKSTNRGDRQIKALISGSLIASAPVSVVVPDKIATPHDTAGSGVMIENRALNETTSPALADIPSDQFALVTVYIRNLTIAVTDQFGDSIGDIYTGAEITERLANSVTPVKLNQSLTTSSTYTDPVGGFPRSGIVIPANDPRINTWPSQPKIPAPSGTNTNPQTFSVFVDGFRLNPDPAVNNRTITVVGDGHSVTSPPVSVTITWP